MPAPDELELPLSKRRRLEDGSSIPVRPKGSRFFSPFRTVGLVSPTAVPFTAIPLGTTTFQITTSVGRSLQTYDLLKGLNLVFLSRPQTPERITAIQAYRQQVFVAWAGASSAGVWIYQRGKLIGTLESVSNEAMHQIIIFGTWIVGCGHSTIEVWKSSTYEHYTTITPSPSQTGSPSRAMTGNVCTLPTYLNKVFISRYDGLVEMYNVRTGKLIHAINPPSSMSGAVTALVPASAISLLAIAYEDGALCIHDIDAGETIMQLRLPGVQKPITCISFRSDGLGAGDDGRSDGIIATASTESGDVTFWDLNNGGRVVGVLRGAHDITSDRGSGITKIEFLPSQPVLISTGLDNSLKSWVFDQTPFSAVPRPLHTRSGHAAPVTKLRFLPSASDGSETAGKWLMSAGHDRSLWAFSLRRDGQHTELSQGNIKSKVKKTGQLHAETSAIDHLKVSPIIDIACSLNRDGGMGAIGGAVWSNPKSTNAEQAQTTGWESVVTAHQDDHLARTWFWGRKKAGRWTFETSDKSAVTSVAVTTCGTFALIGSQKGSLDMFNLQSGIHRQRFPPRLNAAQAKALRLKELSGEALQPLRGHSAAIVGVVVDDLNQNVVSASLDGSVRIWGFTSGHLVDKLTLKGAVPSAMRYRPVSGLASIACDDGCIRVLDIETRKIVRELWGCVGQVYDHCFSHDGRWVLACSMDFIVRVFDLATGHLIDAFKTPTCTNMAFSSTGEYLATSHAGEIGIRIWTNKSLYMHIPSRRIDETTDIIDLTAPGAFEGVLQLSSNAEEADDTSEDDELGQQSDIDQLDKALLTLSLGPRSRWQTLLNLDEVRERNKPIQPPEKPKVAPFFLSSSLLLNGAQSRNDDGLAVADRQEQITVSDAISQDASRISKLTTSNFDNSSTSQSTFSTLLAQFSMDSRTTRDPDPAAPMTHLSSLGPSATDLALRTLSTTELVTFIHCLTAQLRQRKDFELVNAWMSVVLKLHGDVIAAQEEGGFGEGHDGDDDDYNEDENDNGHDLGNGDVNDLRNALKEWRDVMGIEAERLGELVGYVKGVVGWVRSAR